jgi:hypothetical protein
VNELARKRHLRSLLMKSWSDSALSRAKVDRFVLSEPLAVNDAFGDCNEPDEEHEENAPAPVA